MGSDHPPVEAIQVMTEDHGRDGKYLAIGFLVLAVVAFVGGCVVSRIMESVR